jgi:hypothetical protein
MRYREADSPAHDECEYSIDDNLELPHSENILVHDQDRGLDKTEPNDGDHVDGKFGL